MLARTNALILSSPRTERPRGGAAYTRQNVGRRVRETGWLQTRWAFLCLGKLEGQPYGALGVSPVDLCTSTQMQRWLEGRWGSARIETKVLCVGVASWQLSSTFHLLQPPTQLCLFYLKLLHHQSAATCPVTCSKSAASL